MDKLYWTTITWRDWLVCLAATSKGVCYIGLGDDCWDALENWRSKQLPGYTPEEHPERLKPFASELLDYLNGRRRSFDLPIDLHGTVFRLVVWHELLKVPYGQTASYSEIAERIGKPSAVRAVATAIGSNPLLIVVPCHRIIGRTGKLSGYRDGIDKKERLLELERKIN